MHVNLGRINADSAVGEFKNILLAEDSADDVFLI
jgi:hypothetical protein